MKELKGKNIFDEFKKRCHARGLNIQEIDLSNQVDIYKRLNEDIEF